MTRYDIIIVNEINVQVDRFPKVKDEHIILVLELSTVKEVKALAYFI